MVPYVLHHRAAEEFDAVFAWYESRNPEVAQRFAGEVESAISRIREAPRSFPAWPKVDPTLGVRRCLLSSFPYSIPFLIEADTVFVLAFAHQRRRPGYWARRIRRTGRRGSSRQDR